MSLPKYEQVADFLTRNLEHMHSWGGIGNELVFPKFDQMSFDYLEYAEEEMAKDSAAARISCIGHLKRAVECELDTMLAVLHLTKYVEKFNFPEKLKFVGAAGIVTPHSLTKLNKMRNLMEHEYAIPDQEEIEIYFDVASSFVQSMEGYIFMLYGHGMMQWSGKDWLDSSEIKKEHGDKRFVAALKFDPPTVIFDLEENGAAVKLSFNVTSLAEYIEGLKIYFLMCRATTLISRDYVISKLQGKPLSTRGRPG